MSGSVAQAGTQPSARPAGSPVGAAAAPEFLLAVEGLGVSFDGFRAVDDL